VNKFDSRNDTDGCNPTKEDILARLSRAQSLEEYEFIFKNIKDDVADSKIESTYDQKVQDIKNALKEMSEVLKEQTVNFPKLNFLLESNLSGLVKAFREEIHPFFDEQLSIANSIFEFNSTNAVSIDSKLIKGEQAGMLRKWISNGTVRFKLIYRGTRDGFSASAFHSKCDKFKPTVSIIQSNNNKIFGGFTDQDWTVSANYKTSSNVFLFSITEKQKFFLKPNMAQNSSYGNASFLATFGGGHDFCLSDNCNTVNTSYSNFGHSYETNGKPKEFLTGSYNFSVKEIEVYTIGYTGELLVTKEKKSKKNK